MSEKHQGYVVTFEKDISEEHAENVINALKQIRGVLTVKAVVADYEALMAEDRVRHEMGKKLWRVLYPESSL